MAVTREQLYAEVWAEPMTTVAERYGVSSNALAKTCQRLRVPHPSRGYWQQLEVGKADTPPTLPAPQPGDAIEWVRRHEGVARTVPWPLPEPPARRRKRSRSADRSAEHPLVAATRAHFDDARTSYDNEYLKPIKRLVVDVFVTKPVLARAMQMASDLFLSLEDRGHRVALAPPKPTLWRTAFDQGEKRAKPSEEFDRWTPARPTVVFVGTVAVGLTIYEISEQVEMRYENGGYVRADSTPAPIPRRRGHAPAMTWTTTKELGSARLGVRAYSPYPHVHFDRHWHERTVGELPALFQKDREGA